MKAEIRILADVSSTGVAYLFKMKAERRQAAILGLHLSPVSCLYIKRTTDIQHSQNFSCRVPPDTTYHVCYSKEGITILSFFTLCSKKINYDRDGPVFLVMQFSES